MKQHFNLHTHTVRCHHAVGYDEQYIKSAIDAKFTTIGFTEHMPYPGVEIESDRMFNCDVDEYIETMYRLKEKYKDQIEVLVGFEIEYYDDQVEYLLKMKERCDYFIIGQHFKYYDGYNYDHFNNDEDVIVYANQIAKGLALGLSKYVAHPDYFMLGRRNFNHACKEAARIIIEAALKYNAVLEINLNGLRYGKLYYEDGMEYAYPRPEFFKLVSESNCPVCFGYDAHHPATLLESNRIRKCKKILGNIDLNYIDNPRLIISPKAKETTQ